MMFTLRNWFPRKFFLVTPKQRVVRGITILVTTSQHLHLPLCHQPPPPPPPPSSSSSSSGDLTKRTIHIMSHGAKYKDRINRKIENRVHLNTLFGGDGGKGGVIHLCRKSYIRMLCVAYRMLWSWTSPNHHGSVSRKNLQKSRRKIERMYINFLQVEVG